MALKYYICFLAIVVSVTQGNQTTHNLTTVYRFSPLYYDRNYIDLEPRVPITNSTGYTICLRVSIWRWAYTVVVDSPSVLLLIDIFNAGFYLCICLLNNIRSLCSLWVNVNSEWNALCFTHNFTDSLMAAFLNGVQIGSKKIQLPSNFTEELAKPFSIGFNTSFWGQITDFNTWNRPLSNEEVHQYSFGCQDGLSTQPEILDWSTANVVERRVNSDQFKMQRQHFNCQFGMKQSQTLFQNTIEMNYTKSIILCNLLKGDLFHPTYMDRNEFDQFYHFYWVPIVKSEDYGQSKGKNDSQVGIETKNSALTFGQQTDVCTIVNPYTNKHFQQNCYDDFPSICKVTVHIIPYVELFVAHVHLT
jgi:hypothetical protein